NTPGIIIRRVPQRSMSQPTTGHANAVSHVALHRAVDRSPRLRPRSSVTGLRKTPNEKIRMEPVPTSKPQAQANTIHQRLARIPPITASAQKDTAGFLLSWRRLGRNTTLRQSDALVLPDAAPRPQR